MRRNNFAVWLVLGGVVLGLVALASSGQSQPLNDDPAIEPLQRGATEFLQGISRDGDSVIESWYQKLLAGSPLADSPERLKTMIERTRDLSKKYGKYRGVEILPTRRIGQDLVLIKVLHKFERLPVVWYFTYYRPGSADKWTLVTVRFDTELELLGL
jgi:hypothetical protein